MGEYIGGSDDHGKGRQKHDFANLLCGTDRIARMAAEFATHESREELPGGCRCEKHEDRDRNAQMRCDEDQPHQPADQERQIASCFLGRPDRHCNAIRACWRKDAPVPDHDRTAGAGCCQHRNCSKAGIEAGECSKRGGAQSEGQNHRDDAVGADAAVLHDRERVFPVASAAQSIGCVCKTVLVQRTRHQSHQ